MMPRISLSNATLQRSWRRGFEARTHSKGFLNPKQVLNNMTSCLKNDVGRCPNIAQISITGPTTQNLDNMVRDTRQSGRSRRTNTKTVARIIPRNTSSLQNKAEPGINHGRRQRRTSDVQKQRTRGRTAEDLG